MKRRGIFAAVIIAWILCGHAAQRRVESEFEWEFPDQCAGSSYAAYIFWPIWWPIAYFAYPGPLLPHYSKQQRWEYFHRHYHNLSFESFNHGAGYCVGDLDPNFAPEEPQ